MAKRRSTKNKQETQTPKSNTQDVKPLYKKKHNIEDVQPFKDVTGTSRKLTKEMVIARRILVLQEFARGKAPEVIAYEIGTSEEIVQRELDIALEKIANEYTHASPSQIFAKYATFQFGVLNKIQKAYERFAADPSMKSASAQISALKTQSDIYDKIIQKGVDFGIIQNKRKKKAQDLQSQNPDQLAGVLQQEIQEMIILLNEINPNAANKIKQQFKQEKQTQPKTHTKQNNNSKLKQIPKHKKQQLDKWMFKGNASPEIIKEQELQKALEIQVQLHKSKKENNSSNQDNSTEQTSQQTNTNTETTK